MRIIRLLSLGLMSIAWLLGNPAGAQSASGPNTQPQTPNTTSAVLVDGALHPELIPDDVAFLHFFKALAKNPNVDQGLEERRRRAYINHFFAGKCSGQDRDLALNEGQIMKLLALVDGLDAELTTAWAAADKSAADDQAVEQQVRALVLRAASNLASVIDSEADTKIRFQVSDHVKSRIRIISTRVPAQ